MICDNIVLTKLFQTRLFVCFLKKTSLFVQNFISDYLYSNSTPIINTLWFKE